MKFALLLLAVLSLAVTPALADVLWDQSDVDDFGAGFFNSISGSPPFGSTIYCVSDVTVPASGWEINSITVYFSALDPAWGDAISQGALHIWPKTGPMPIQDPALSPLVPMTATLDVLNNRFVVTASGLSEGIPAGEYWIGITPQAPSSPFGSEIHLPSFTYIGGASPIYDVYAFPGPPAWTDFNPGVDAAILIEGAMGPVPVESVTWGQLKGRHR